MAPSWLPEVRRTRLCTSTTASNTRTSPRPCAAARLRSRFRGALSCPSTSRSRQTWVLFRLLGVSLQARGGSTGAAAGSSSVPSFHAPASPVPTSSPPALPSPPMCRESQSVLMHTVQSLRHVSCTGLFCVDVTFTTVTRACVKPTRAPFTTSVPCVSPCRLGPCVQCGTVTEGRVVYCTVQFNTVEYRFSVAYGK